MDPNKLQLLGLFKLPVEVVQYGAENLFRHFEQKGYHPAFRIADDQRFVTDQGNFIIDLDLKVIENAEALANELDHTVGVVEHGLFLNMISKVIVGTPDGPVIIENREWGQKSVILKIEFDFVVPPPAQLSGAVKADEISAFRSRAHSTTASCSTIQKQLRG